MLAENRIPWRRVTWPTLFFTSIYLIFCPIPGLTVEAAVTTYTDFNDEGQADTVVMAEGLAEQITFGFGYDDKGNRESVTYPSLIQKHWNHTYTDDVLTQHVETQPGGMPWKTTDYDPETGLKALLTDAGGNVTSYEYEGYRLKRQTETPAGSEGPEKNYFFDYDDNGQTREVRTSSGNGSEACASYPA
jgi:hypothetical protein